MRTGKRGKIASKILWPFVILFSLLIISLVGSLSNFVSEKTRMIVRKEARMKMNVARYHLEISKEFVLNEMKNLSVLLAQMVTDGEKLNVISPSLKAAEGIADYYIMQVLGKRGEVIAEGIHDNLPLPDHRPGFSIENVTDINSVIPDDVTIKKNGDSLWIEVLTPISQEGERLGYLRLYGKLGTLLCSQMGKELELPVFLIVNEKVSASSSPSMDLGPLSLPPRFAQRIEEREGGIVEHIFLKKQEYVACFLPLSGKGEGDAAGHLMIPIDTGIFREFSMGVIRTGVVYGFLGVMILTFMGVLIAKGITLPLEELVSVTRRVGKGDLNYTMKTRSNDEIEELSAAFEKMTDDLKKTTVSKDYVDKIIEGMMESLAVLDTGYSIQMVNKAFCRLLGYEESEIVGMPLDVIFPGEGYIPVRLKDISKKGEGIRNFETYYKTKDGSLIPVLFSESVMENKEGNVQCVICTANDISDRKRAEERLRQSEIARAEKERLFSVLEVLPALVYLQSPDRSIPFANRTFRNLFGDPCGRPCYQILHGRNQPCEECSFLKGLQKKRTEKRELIISEGHTYEVYDTLFKDIDGTEMLLELGIDITERKEMERARKEAERLLEEQRARAILSDRLRSLGEMATSMAHELNQPLSGIRSLAEYILLGCQRGWKVTKENILEKIKLIIEQTDRMSHVIEHARMFARGADDAELLPVNINDVIRSSMELIGAQLKSRGIALIRDLCEDIPCVLANPFSLEEVIINLVTNARDSLTEGCGQQEPRITLRSERVRGGIKIEVIDNGAGIPEQYIDHVFDPFFTTKEPDKGTGLGLSIAKSIVEGFKGGIAVQSKPGSGTRITIFLPAFVSKEGNV